MRQITFFIVLCLVSSISVAQAQTEPTLTRIGRGAIESVQWYADGERVFVTTASGAWIYTADLRDVGHLPEVALAQLSPDGTRIVGVDNQHRIRFWDAETLAPLPLLENFGYLRRVSLLAWSRDGRYLAASGERNEPLVYVWDTQDNFNVMWGSRLVADQLVWSPFADLLIVVNPDALNISTWSVNPVTITYLDGWAQQIIWLDAAHVLVIRIDEIAEGKLWNVETGKNIRDYTTFWYVSDLSHSDGKLATGTYGQAKIVDLAGDTTTLSMLIGEKYGWVSSLSWRGDDAQLAVGTGYIDRVAPQIVLIYDTQSGGIVGTFHGLRESVDHLAWHPDNRRLIATDGWGRIFVFDTVTGATLAYSEAHALVGSTLTWSPDSTQMMIAGSDDTLMLWDVEQNVRMRQFKGNAAPVNILKWQRTDSQEVIFTFNAIGQENLFGVNLTTGNIKPIPQIPPDFNFYEPNQPVYGIAIWSPNGERLSLGWGTTGDPSPPKTIDVSYCRLTPPDFSYLAETGSNCQLLEGLLGNTSIGFLSPTGRYAAAIDGKGSGMIWDADSGAPIAMLADAALMAWSPDEAHLVLLRTDGSVWLMQADGTILQVLSPATSQPPTGSAFFWSPDSQQVAHLHDGMVDLWRFR
ncbi:MAG: hypothetical protein H7Y11_08895 [Armatimonadetes bacterium]|nr:hypothetical protein [Anaerolineae bacterium]